MPRHSNTPLRPPSQKTAAPYARTDEQCLGRIEAAALLAVNSQTIDKLIREGSLRAYRIGRRVVIRRDELLRYRDQNEVS